MNAKTNTTGTTTPAPSTPLPSRRQRTEWFPRANTNQPADGDTFPHLAVEQDPDRARKLGNEIQAAGQRADLAALRARNEFTRGMRTAVDKFSNAALNAPDPTATWIRGLAQGVQQYADRIEAGAPAPEPSNIRPEVPGDGTEADRG